MSIQRRSQVDGKVERRGFLQSAAAVMSLGTVSGCAKALYGGRSASWMADVAGYLESVRGADGGYRWWAEERSHLTPSYAAAGCYHLMGQEPPNKNALAEYIRTHHPFRVKKLERDLRVFEYEWRWWDNPRIRRPMVSIVAVGPEDEWETARPTLRFWTIC